MGSKVLSLFFLASLTGLVSSQTWTASCYDESSYLLGNTTLNWTAAQAECETNSANLACIESLAEQNFISSLLVGKAGAFFTAGNDITTEGTWVWGSSTEEIATIYWEPGQPQGAEDCLALEAIKPAASNWHDYGCQQELWYICEK